MLLVCNSVCLLQFTDITDDPRNLFRANLRLGGHIPVWPMMLFRPVLRRKIKRTVRMMPGIVDSVYQRRTLFRAGCIPAMTSNAVLVEELFSNHRFLAETGQHYSISDTCRSLISSFPDRNEFKVIATIPTAKKPMTRYFDQLISFSSSDAPHVMGVCRVLEEMAYERQTKQTGTDLIILSYRGSSLIRSVSLWGNCAATDITVWQRFKF